MFSPPDFFEGGTYTNIRNEIKSIIVREGVTMGEVVRRLAERYDWSDSIPNFTGKLKRGSLKYREALEVADVLGYDLLWQKREPSGARNPVVKSGRKEG